MKKSGGVMVVKLFVSAVFLGIFFTRVEVTSFWSKIASVRSDVFLAGAGLFLLAQGVSTYRWFLILKRDMYVSFPKLLSIYFIGMFFNNFLPTLVGGDVIKGYYLYKISGREDVSAASIFMDRYAGFSALMFILVSSWIGGASLIRDPRISYLVGLMFAAYLLGSLVIWIDPIRERVLGVLGWVRVRRFQGIIAEVCRALIGYRRDPKLLVQIFFFSIVIQSIVIAGYYVVAKGLGMMTSLGYFFLLIPLTTAASMLPIAFSGIGVREGAFVILFAWVGASQEEALSLSLLCFGISAVVSLAGGIEFVRAGGRKPLESSRPG